MQRLNSFGSSLGLRSPRSLVQYVGDQCLITCVCLGPDGYEYSYEGALRADNKELIALIEHTGREMMTRLQAVFHTKH